MMGVVMKTSFQAAKWLDDAGYSTGSRNAGYIYASKIGSLKD